MKTSDLVQTDVPAFHLLAWDEDGKLVFNRILDDQVLSIASSDDADVAINFALDGEIYVRKNDLGASLMHHGRDKHTRKNKDLFFGSPANFAGLTWLLTKDTQAAHHAGDSAHSHETNAKSSDFLSELIPWVRTPMNNTQELRKGLASFLEIVVDHTMSQSGILVSVDAPGFSLVAAFGVTAMDAEQVWSKIPDSICEEIMRSEAKILMPEGLRERVGSASTVFVRGVRSMVGFPIFAEGRVIAILFLGFMNVMRDLSEDMQSEIENACSFCGLVVQRALLRQELAAAKIMAPATSAGAHFPPERLLLGSSEPIAEVYRIITRIAPINVPTLILGETGTGKELAAREIHRLSDRARAPFMAVNAAALPETLFESELFGHRKGAFTGALSDHKGLIEKADGGTLFIDEIGELPLSMQSKLLRVLQEKSIVRIGETDPRPVDFRLVAATHRNLQAMVEKGTFREDLYYRIAGALVHMPRLKDRPGDVLSLANFFKQRFARFHNLPEKEWSSDALIALETAEWRGNVRELENTVSRAMVMAEGLIIRSSDLGFTTDSATVRKEGITASSSCLDLETARNEWLRSFIEESLRRNGGNRAKTAKALGIGQRTLFRYIEQFEL